MERTITYQFCSHNSDNIYAYLIRINKFLEDYYSVYFQKEDVSFDIYKFDQQMEPNMVIGDIIPSFVKHEKKSFYFTNYSNPKVLFEKIEKLVLDGYRSYDLDHCLVLEFIQPITNETNSFIPQYDVKDPFKVIFQFNSRYYRTTQDFYDRIHLYINQYYSNELDYLNISHEFFIKHKTHEITHCDIVNSFEKNNVFDFLLLNFKSPIDLEVELKSKIDSVENDNPIVVKLIFEVLPF